MNKGEWSECFVWITLLINGSIIINNQHYIIQSIQFSDTKQLRRDHQQITCFHDQNPITNTSITELRMIQQIIQNAIRTKKGTFDIPLVTAWAQKLQLPFLKNPSHTEPDLRLIVLNDHQQPQTLSFHIKSFVAHPPTLFNASQKRRIRYRLPDWSSCLKLPSHLFFHEQLQWMEAHSRVNFERFLDPFWEQELNVIRPDFSSELADLIWRLFEKQHVDLNHQTMLLHSFFDHVLAKQPTDGFVCLDSDFQLHLFTNQAFLTEAIQHLKWDQASKTRYQYGVIKQDQQGYYIDLVMHIRMHAKNSSK